MKNKFPLIITIIVVLFIAGLILVRNTREENTSKETSTERKSTIDADSNPDDVIDQTLNQIEDTINLQNFDSDFEEIEAF